MMLSIAIVEVNRALSCMTKPLTATVSWFHDQAHAWCACEAREVLES
jgi:hypothetical protein